MFTVDTALAERHATGNPVRVGLVGGGFMARGIAFQVERHLEGMTIAAIANRTLSHAVEAFRDAGVEDPVEVHTPEEADGHLRAGRRVVTTDPSVLAGAAAIEGVIDATIDIEYSTRVAMAAIGGRKSVVTLNAGTDATVGSLLESRASVAGVVYTGAGGGRRSSLINLIRSVDRDGYRPVLAGVTKGFKDVRRTPLTQNEFAAKYGLSPQAAASFADGTRMSLAQAVVANAAGFRVGRRGMYGPKRAHVSEAPGAFPVEEMLEQGLVDYLLGAQPSSAVFVIGYGEHPMRQHYMRRFKMGDGPLYVFYAPFHPPHLEAPLILARGILLGGTSVSPNRGSQRDRPQCDVLAVAKRNLEPGDVLDGVGGFTSYGEIDNSATIASQGLLLMGLSAGSRVVRPVPMDDPITVDDVELDVNRLTVQVRREQDDMFDSPGSQAATVQAGNCP